MSHPEYETRLESTWSSKKGLNLKVERSWSLEFGVWSLEYGVQKDLYNIGEYKNEKLCLKR